MKVNNILIVLFVLVTTFCGCFSYAFKPVVQSQPGSSNHKEQKINHLEIKLFSKDEESFQVKNSSTCNKMRINKDLLRGEVTLDAGRYGQYYARMRTGDGLGYHAHRSHHTSGTYLKRYLPDSYGGVEFGGFSNGNSSFYMKLGVESNTRRIGISPSPLEMKNMYTAQTAPSFLSGIGVQYSFGSKVSIRGEALMNDRTRLSSLISNSGKDITPVKSRENRFVFGLNYRFG